MNAASLRRLLLTLSGLLIAAVLSSCASGTQTAGSLTPQDRVGGCVYVPPMSELAYRTGTAPLGTLIANAIRVNDSQIPRDEAFARQMRDGIEDELSRGGGFTYVRSGALQGIPAFDTRNPDPFHRINERDIASRNQLRVFMRIDTELIIKTRRPLALVDSPAVKLTIFPRSSDGKPMGTDAFGIFYAEEITTEAEEHVIKKGTDEQKAAAYTAAARRATRKFLSDWAKYCASAKGKHP